MRCFVIFIALISTPFTLKAQTKTIEINDRHNSINLIEHVEIFAAEDSKITFEELQSFNGFKENSRNVFKDFYNNDILWVRFKIKNLCLQDERFIIEIPNATINDITFYKEEKAETFSTIKTGASHAFSTRDIHTRHFTFDIEIPRGETRTYYIKIISDGDSMNLPLVLWRIVPYISRAIHERFLMGIYYGSILFIVIFHFFLFLKFRDKALIYYMLYVAGFAGYQLSMDGYVAKYVLFNAPYLTVRTVSIFAYLSLGAMINFIQLYLNTATFIPRFNKILTVFKYISFTCIIFCFLPYEIFILFQHFINFFGPLSTFTVILTAILFLKREPILSKYLIIAFTCLIGGLLIEVVKNVGAGYISDYGVKLGHASEAIILAFALAVRFKLNNEKTQLLALESLKTLNQLKDQYKEELENMVLQRTEELNVSNKSVNDSIRYARHIQYSLLPSKKLLDEHISDHFIFFKPKDIISGDFYWFEKVDSILVMAVVDCTGHGVPGAFMSMLGSTILRETVKTKRITKPDQILSFLDSEVRLALNQNNEDPYNRDGMDLSVICLNLDNFHLSFSGAKRPLIHFSENELHFYKGSKYSIGGDLHEAQHSKGFCTINIPIKKGDSIYLFTDGIIDQFGGESDKKFMITRLKELLSEIHGLPMESQGNIIEDTFEKWKGDLEQVDDILIMGLRF